MLVLQPGSGDSIQALKAGVMEIPDVIVINKADHPATRTMRSEIRSILSLDRERPWKPPIVETEAIRGEGVDRAVGRRCSSHRAHLERDGGLEQRRRRSIEHEVVAVAVSQVRRRLSEAIEGDAEVRRLLDRRARAAARPAHGHPRDRRAGAEAGRLARAVGSRNAAAPSAMISSA